MTTDYELAVYCQNQYDGLMPICSLAGVNYSFVEDDNSVNVIFEGSKNLPDYERDFAAIMIFADGVGGVHGGFWEGLTAAVEAIKGRLDGHKLIRLIGHSLGAGEASLATCIFGKAGYGNLECVTFGCPLFGNAQTVAYLNGFPNRTYWNYRDWLMHDIVGSVPVRIPPDEDYVNPPNRTFFWSAPTPANPWGQGHHLAPHNMRDCYLPGMEKLCAPS